MIETKALVEKLEAMSASLEQSSKDRHRVNGVLHSTMNSLVTKTTEQDSMLSKIHDAVARIEGCLLGDEKFQRAGLIADVIQLKASHDTLQNRLEGVEGDVKSRTRAVIIVFTVLTTLGGIVTWLKSTGMVRFFTEK